MTKHCRKCDTPKPVSEFNRNRSKSDGLQTRCRACQRGDTSKWYGENAEHKNDYSLRWQRDRRTKDRLFDRLRVGPQRARRYGCEVENFVAADLLSYWESRGIDPSRCYYTGEVLGEDFHLDHMTPLSRGGSHSVDNLVPCSRAVNQSKGDKSAEEYRQDLVAE